MAYRTVFIKGDPRYDEADASGAITPGFLLEEDSNSDVQAHSTAGGEAAPFVAFENELEGEGIDTDYSSGDRCRYLVCKKGDEVVMRIANGEDIDIGDKLVSNGDGKLKELTADSSGVVDEEAVIAISKDDVDMSGSSAVDPANKCKVTII